LTLAVGFLEYGSIHELSVNTNEEEAISKEKEKENCAISKGSKKKIVMHQAGCKSLQ
jgi:hypothetical protein